MPSISGEGIEFSTPPSNATQSGLNGFQMILAANMLWLYSLILSIFCR
jgi:hypothetical protein